MLFQPRIVLKRACAKLRAPGDDFWKKLLIFHHLNGRQTVEKRESALVYRSFAGFGIRLLAFGMVVDNSLKPPAQSLIVLGERHIALCLNTKSQPFKAVGKSPGYQLPYI